MASLTSINLSTPRVILAKATTDAPKAQPIFSTWRRTGNGFRSGRMQVVFRPIRAARDSISDKVAESIKDAEQTCADDPASGECVAAWDEVEELSAAASHARDKKKDSDPLETYCKDNPETDECRTYDN